MGAKKKYNLFFIGVIAVLVGLSVWWLFLKQPVKDAIRLGLDLQSGTHLLLELEPDLKWTGSKDDLTAAESALSDMQKKNVSPDIVKALESVDADIDNTNTVSQKDYDAAKDALAKLGYVAEAQPWQTLFTKLSPGEVTPDDLGRVKEVLERRTNEFGTKEPIIQNFGADRIIVDLPSVTDPEAAQNMVSKQAFLEFKELTPKGVQYFESHNSSAPDYTDPTMWKTVMNGSALEDAYEAPQGGSQGAGNSYVVEFQLTNLGKQIFGDVTTRNVGRPIAIYLDGKLISAPNVHEPITQGQGEIESFPEKDAHQLAIFLKSGALPIPIKVEESVTVGPTLGHEALIKSLAAGLLGLLMVIVFMLVFYRLPGFVAGIALLIYALWLLAIMSIFFVLTLPGIAGVVLTIGMAVDANILIFERVKEELWAGKSIATAVDIGFHRAWSSIWDSHVTTIVGAAALIWKGSSSIQGFGVALLVGTILSLITAWGVTRVLLDWTVFNNVTSSTKAYGA